MSTIPPPPPPPCSPDDVDDLVRPTMLERRPLRPFKSSEEYLYAMKEDLADWLTTLYGLDIGADTFLEVLETGVVLCRHANNVRCKALECDRQRQWCQSYPVPERDVTYRTDVTPGTFQARDNVSNFIRWCRALGIYECLLFETDDLVLRKNEKSFILCLLEVARRGSKVGMLAPLLVQMEEEIDREIAAEERTRTATADASSSTDDPTADDDDGHDEVPWQSPVQIITNDLKNLHEMVRGLVERCTCPLQFPMIRVSEGKYRIGDTKILIYVRILRSHVMVRVGGGWDTLAHFLDKHDPCRCRQGHRAPLSSKLTVKFGGANGPAQTQMEVTYHRSPVPISPSSHSSPFVPARQRSVSPMAPTSPTRQRRNSTSSLHKLSNGSLASLQGDNRSAASTTSATSALPPTSVASTDSSSEYSDDGYKSGSRIPTNPDIQKQSPKKLVKLIENSGGSENPPDNSPRDSLLGEEEEETGSSPVPEDDDVIRFQEPAKNSNHRARRLSGDSIPTTTTFQSQAAVRRMPRSRSQSSEVNGCGGSMATGSGFARNQTGRHSYRSPQSFELHNHCNRHNNNRSSSSSVMSPDKNNTWSFRSRSCRPLLGTDLFFHDDHSRSPPPPPSTSRRPTTMAAVQRSKAGGGPQSLQTSPSKHYAPLLQQMLADGALDSDDKVLERMASILRQRKMSAPNPTFTDQPHRHHRFPDETSTPSSLLHPDASSPDSGSELGLEPVARLLKVSPRKDNYPHSGSKIPVPTFY